MWRLLFEVNRQEQFADDVSELLLSVHLEKQTPHTLIQPARIKKDLAKTRVQGYALDDEEAVLGARCIAAPIFDGSAKVIGGVSVSGPLTRIRAEKIPLFSSMVKTTAYSISRRLGYQKS